MHNVEIELKFRAKDFSGVKSILERVGANFIKESVDIDTYFILPNNPEGRKYLRVREKNGRSELSFKYVKTETHKHEWETEVKSAEMTKAVLEQLGFKVDVIVDKKRSIFHYKNSEILLDDVKDLGKFIEIESPNVTEIEDISKELNLVKMILC